MATPTDLHAEMLLRFAQIGGRIGGLDTRMGRLEVKLTKRLSKVVVPVLIASNLLIATVAT